MIIAFDPGYTTGVAVIDNFRPLPAPQLVEFDVIAAFDIPWQDRIGMVRDLLANNRDRIKAIVYEQYKLFPHADAIRQQIGSEIPSARVIGVIEAEADRCGLFDRIVAQETWARKQIAIPVHHGRLLTGSRHRADAYGHAAYFARINWATLVNGG